MPTHEERLHILEQATTGYRAVLRDISYELTILKGIVITQEENIRELKQDTADIKDQLKQVTTKIEYLETRSNTHTELLNDHTRLLNEILARLPDKSK
jgi:hypothetical protein